MTWSSSHSPIRQGTVRGEHYLYQPLDQPKKVCWILVPASSLDCRTHHISYMGIVSASSGRFGAKKYVSASNNHHHSLSRGFSAISNPPTPFTWLNVNMADQRRRLLAPAPTGPGPIKNIPKRTKASRACTACQEKKTRVRIQFLFLRNRSAPKVANSVLVAYRARSAVRVVPLVKSTWRVTNAGEFYLTAD